MIYPLPALSDGRRPRVTSHYGELRDDGARRHLGVDILYPAAPGDPAWPGYDTPARSRGSYMPARVPALAVLAGKVLRVTEGAYGWAVTIATDLGLLRYVHLASTSVVPGRVVFPGEKIGIVGAPRPPRGPLRHLHLDLIDGEGSQVDPEPLIRKTEVIPWPSVAYAGVAVAACLGTGYFLWRRYVSRR